jgi:hypothetical protein
MSRQFNFAMPKTYATPENAQKAVEKTVFRDLDYVIAVDSTGRYFPLFVGQSALQSGVHFKFAIISRH